MGVGELAGVAGRHALVVLAVHHEQRTRAEPAGRVGRAEPAERPAPLVDRRREARRADRPDLPGVLEEAAGVLGPVVEVGARAEQAARSDPWVVGADADGDRAARVRAEEHDLRRPALGGEVVDGAAQVVDPALQREVPAAGARAAEVERHRRVAEVVGDAVDQLGERAGRAPGVERPDREAVAEDHAGSGLVAPGGDDEVAGEGVPAGREGAVHGPSRLSGSWLAVPPVLPRGRQGVAAVAGLDQRVRPEADARSRRPAGPRSGPDRPTRRGRTRAACACRRRIGRARTARAAPWPRTVADRRRRTRRREAPRERHLPPPELGSDQALDAGGTRAGSLFSGSWRGFARRSSLPA